MNWYNLCVVLMLLSGSLSVQLCRLDSFEGYQVGIDS